MSEQNPDLVAFGRYQLVSLLGEGGMAKVYRAVMSGPMGFEKDVALKRIDNRLTRDERVVKALINEARLGGQLRHKNIVEIYEFNQIDGHYFMAMEFIDGWTIDQLLRACRESDRQLPPGVAIELMERVCLGLHHAHTLVSKDGQALNLVHRDLKPANIIVSRAAEVKIMDFGIAKADTNLYKTTTADATKGTPMYMSPEQITGDPLDCRSDLFSAGGLLYELATLQPAFRADNLLGIMHAIVHVDGEDLGARVAERVPQLGPIAGRLLALAPENRYSSAAELGEALEDCRAAFPAQPNLASWLAEMEPLLPSGSAVGDFGPDGAPRSLASSPEQGTVSMIDVGEFSGGAGATPREELENMSSEVGSGTVLAPDWSRRKFEPAAQAGTTELRQGSARGWLLLAASLGVLALVLVLVFGPEGPPLSAPDGQAELPAVQEGEGGAAGEQAPSEASLEGAGEEAEEPQRLAEATTEPKTEREVSEEPTREPEPTKVKPERKKEETAKEVPAKEVPAKEEPAKEEPAKEAESAEEAEEAEEPKAPPEAEEEASTPTTKLVPVLVPSLSMGTLRVNSRPYADIYLDGTHIGVGSVTDYKVKPGRHTLRFVCSEACSPTQEKSVSFTAVAGQEYRKAMRFTVPTEPLD